MRQYFLSLIAQLQQRTEGRTLLRAETLTQAFSIHSLYVVGSLQSFNWAMDLHFGVVVAPATLLFRLCFFSFVPGEIGLFSATLTAFFIVGATSAVLLSGIVEIFGGGPIPLGRC